MTTQSIIVYRNPAEAMLWESGMVWPLMVACFVAFVSFLIVFKLVEPRNRRNTSNIPTGIAAFVALGCAIMTLKYMGAV